MRFFGLRYFAKSVGWCIKIVALIRFFTIFAYINRFIDLI